MRILDLGCGKNKLKGAIGVDMMKMEAVDVVHDLNKFPYPFPDNHFNIIRAHSILEHLDDIHRVMTELYRITIPDGIIKIHTPYWRDENAYADITHKHLFSKHSFDQFDMDTKSGKEFSHRIKGMRFKLLKAKRIWGKYKFFKSYGLYFELKVKKNMVVCGI